MEHRRRSSLPFFPTSAAEHLTVFPTEVYPRAAPFQVREETASPIGGLYLVSPKLDPQYDVQTVSKEDTKALLTFCQDFMEISVLRAKLTIAMRQLSDENYHIFQKIFNDSVKMSQFPKISIQHGNAFLYLNDALESDSRVAKTEFADVLFSTLNMFDELGEGAQEFMRRLVIIADELLKSQKTDFLVGLPSQIGSRKRSKSPITFTEN